MTISYVTIHYLNLPKILYRSFFGGPLPVPRFFGKFLKDPLKLLTRNHSYITVN